MADRDLEEEEVWSMKSSFDTDSNVETCMNMMMMMSKFNSNKVIVRSCSKPVPQRKSSSTDDQVMVECSSSAPVSIPADWSRIYKKKSRRQLDNNYININLQEDHFDDDHDSEEEEEEKVPPHEFLARKVARSQILSFSMCEGVGRTLKGRDLSKVRNSILIQTGFLEQ